MDELGLYLSVAYVLPRISAPLNSFCVRGSFPGSKPTFGPIGHCEWICFQERQICLFVCVEVLRPSQPNGVMSSAVSLPNHTFNGQA